MKQQRRFRSILAVLLLGATVCYAQATVDGLIKDALQAYQAQQLDNALARLKQAQALEPDNPFVRLYLGLMLYEKDPASTEARLCMESVLDRFFPNPDLSLRLLDSWLHAGETSKVSVLIERMQKDMEANSRLAFGVVYALVNHGQLELARRELDRIKDNPGEVAFVRGLIATSANQKQEALRYFQEADRNEFPARNSPQMRMLAEALTRLEEWRLSAQAYQVYLANSPKDQEARMSLAMALLSVPSFERAREELQKLTAESAGIPQVNYYLGLVLVELKKNDDARRQFEMELRKDPSSYQAMAQLGMLAYLEGDDNTCRAWLEKAAKLSPDWVDTQYGYGLLYNREGKYDQAIASLEKVVAQAPSNHKAQLQLSMAYSRSGDEAKAKEHRDIYDRLIEEQKLRALMEDARRK